VDDLRSPAGWLPVHRDQLRAQRSVLSMGSLYLFTFLLQETVTQTLIMQVMCYQTYRQTHVTVVDIFTRPFAKQLDMRQFSNHHWRIIKCIRHCWFHICDKTINCCNTAVLHKGPLMLTNYIFCEISPKDSADLSYFSWSYILDILS